MRHLRGWAGRRQKNRDQLAAPRETHPFLAAIVKGLIAGHETLCIATEALEDGLKSMARDSDPARCIVTIAGLGPIVSLSVFALVDGADGFRKATDDLAV